MPWSSHSNSQEQGAHAPRSPSLGLSFIILLLVACGARADEAPGLGLKLTYLDVMSKGKFDGPASCMQCHTQPTRNRIDEGALDFVLLTEYPTWKTQDKHAQAYAVLVGPRGQQMQRLLGQNVTKAETGCLNCHAMNYLSRQGNPFSLDEGVSCGGCHGPSEHWFRDHQQADWRKLTPVEKEDKGMLDLRHPVRRAELCLSCHVGNAPQGKVITHAMYAAGHPPLPALEVATFARNLPQHWRDARDVPYFRNASAKTKADYHLQTIDFQRTRFALVGSVIALRETMQLIADRANPKPTEPAQELWPELLLSAMGNGKVPLTPEAARERWPELAMAHSDCYACHHELRYPAWRQFRGYGFPLPDGAMHKGFPGRPQIKPWPIALIELAIVHAARAPGSISAADRTRELTGLLTQLLVAADARPFGEPDKMRAAALVLVKWSQKLETDLWNAPYDAASTREIVRALIGLRSLRYADYETARQSASILQVACEDLGLLEGGPANSAVREILADLQAKLNVRPSVARSERQEVMGQMLSKLAGNMDILEGMKKFQIALDNLGNLEMQKQLEDNAFLYAMQTRISDKKITEMLKDQAIIVSLQAISDKELVNSLKKTNDYDPDAFYRRLQELAKIWPTAK